MVAKKPGKKPRKKKGEVNWACNNPGKAFNLTTLVVMLEDQSSGFAAFFFPVLKNAMANDTAAIKCLESYLAPTDQELIALGVPSTGVGAARKCTDVGLLVAVIAQQNA